MKPPTFEQWKYEHGASAELEYNILKDEYGDAMRVFLSQYLEQKYREFLEEYWS